MSIKDLDIAQWKTWFFAQIKLNIYGEQKYK